MMLARAQLISYKNFAFCKSNGFISFSIDIFHCIPCVYTVSIFQTTLAN